MRPILCPALLMALCAQGCLQSVHFVTDAGAAPDAQPDALVPDAGADAITDAGPSDAGPPSNCPCDGVCWRLAPDLIDDVSADAEGRVFVVRGGRVLSLEGGAEVDIGLPAEAETAESLELLGQRRIYLHVRHEDRSTLYSYGPDTWSPVALPPPPSSESKPLLAEMDERLFFAWGEDDTVFDLSGGGALEVRTFPSETRIHFLSASSQLLAVTVDADVGRTSYATEAMSRDGAWTRLPPVEPPASGDLRLQRGHVAGGLIVRSGTVWDGTTEVAVEATQGVLEGGEYEGAPVIYTAVGGVVDLTDLANPAAFPIYPADFPLHPLNVAFTEGQQIWVAARVVWRFTGFEWQSQMPPRQGFRFGVQHVAGSAEDFWVGGFRFLDGDAPITRIRGERVDEQRVQFRDLGVQSITMNFEPRGDDLFFGTTGEVAVHTTNRTSIVETDGGEGDRFRVASGLGEVFAVGRGAIWALDGDGAVHHRSLDPVFRLLMDAGHLSRLDARIDPVAFSVFEGVDGTPGFWILPGNITNFPLIRFDGARWSLVDLPDGVTRSSIYFAATADEAIIVADDMVHEWDGGWLSTRLELGEPDPVHPLHRRTRTIVADGSRFTIVNFDLVRWTRESRGNWSMDASCRGAQPRFSHAWWPDGAPGPMYFGLSSILETTTVQ